MILSITFSKPVSNVEQILGRPYGKIKIKAVNTAGGTSYFAEMFTKTQVFHQYFTLEELNAFFEEHAGKTFKNCVKNTDTDEITILSNKKGKITELIHPKKQELINSSKEKIILGKSNSQKTKKYLLEEGTPVPFLVLLGIMNSEGKVISSKYDKFKQINRFLEFINDILPVLTENKKETEPVRIIDFGCGKSYLTFAVHYLLTEIKKIPCKIIGLDLKEEVINYCNDITNKLNLENLSFQIGNIEDYNEMEEPDLIITLHACDTATDYALKYAVDKNAKAILSVPCCQHQINQQLNKNINQEKLFNSLLKWGIIQEKFASLLTDALRGEWLEQNGYKVQMLEFIDIEHTPKNILIRAVKTKDNKFQKTNYSKELISALGIKPEIFNL
ncbi:MAG: SAM-dependent methyltransferase [Treponema sp.]|nr:SAM-dependent methyltransferase [Treponema sp.]